uniref:CCH-04 n=1 Tax=Bruguiera gymnorhiza TaxID=39984 RepID=Q4TV05_BRUGY|nr:CCH-04 [Bruguiera gymnorhiza]
MFVCNHLHVQQDNPLQCHQIKHSITKGESTVKKAPVINNYTLPQYHARRFLYIHKS